MLQYHHYIGLLDRFYSYTIFSDDFHTVVISFLGVLPLGGSHTGILNGDRTVLYEAERGS